MSAENSMDNLLSALGFNGTESLNLLLNDMTSAVLNMGGLAETVSMTLESVMPRLASEWDKVSPVLPSGNAVAMGLNAVMQTVARLGSATTPGTPAHQDLNPSTTPNRPAPDDDDVNTLMMSRYTGLALLGGEAQHVSECLTNSAALLQVLQDMTDGVMGLAQACKVLQDTLEQTLLTDQALNVALQTAPIDVVTALAEALERLFDDYTAWQGVGKNLINWSAWGPEIEKADSAIIALRDHLIELKTLVSELKAMPIDLSGMANSGDTGQSSSTEGVIGGLATLGEVIEGWLKVGAMTLAGRVSYIGLLLELEEKVVKPLEHEFSFLVDNPLSQNLNDLPGSESVKKTGEYVRKQLFGNVHLHAGNEGIFPTKKSATQLSVSQHAQAARRAERNLAPADLSITGLNRPDGGDFGGRIARVTPYLEGVQALVRQLLLYAGRSTHTVNGMISTWTPFADGNNAVFSLKAISHPFGVAPDTVINLSNPQVLSALMDGINGQENGRSIYSTDLTGFTAATSIAGSHIQQQNTYHIYGGNAQEVGNEVGRRQLDANSRIMRTSQNRRG